MTLTSDPYRDLHHVPNFSFPTGESKQRDGAGCHWWRIEKRTTPPPTRTIVHSGCERQNRGSCSLHLSSPHPLTTTTIIPCECVAYAKKEVAPWREKEAYQHSSVVLLPMELSLHLEHSKWLGRKMDRGPSLIFQHMVYKKILRWSTELSLSAENQPCDGFQLDLLRNRHWCSVELKT